jgi:hypothetical protein
MTCRVGMKVSGRSSRVRDDEAEQQFDRGGTVGSPLRFVPGGRLFLDDEMLLQNRKLLCRHVNMVCIH